MMPVYTIFTSDDLSIYITECRENGGVVTINPGIYEDGTVGQKALYTRETL
jgi:hypothetical protein